MCFDPKIDYPWAYAKPLNETDKINKFLLKENKYGNVVFSSQYSGIDCRVENIKEFLLYSFYAMYILAMV
jgi:hypothetical protein